MPTRAKPSPEPKTDSLLFTGDAYAQKRSQIRITVHIYTFQENIMVLCE